MVVGDTYLTYRRTPNGVLFPNVFTFNNIN